MVLVVLLLVLVLMLVLVAVAVMVVVAMDGGGTVGGGCSRVRQTEKWSALKGDLIHHRGPCHDRRDPHGIFRTIIICNHNGMLAFDHDGRARHRCRPDRRPHGLKRPGLNHQPQHGLEHHGLKHQPPSGPRAWLQSRPT